MKVEDLILFTCEYNSDEIPMAVVKCLNAQFFGYKLKLFFGAVHRCFSSVPFCVHVPDNVEKQIEMVYKTSFYGNDLNDLCSTRMPKKAVKTFFF